MDTYKIVLMLIDAALIVLAVVLFFNFKKYLKIHKDETVEQNTDALNSYAKKIAVINGLFIVLGVIALIIGVIGKVNS